ncbi:hypothetical protein CORC01_02677 [Colletotrichum orchidophilum]|uniref:Uncharacterized protein n=1 Tax=Colletotrichum orchidophilum TaxID=1209926 RepID=A0A1G4BLC0_9PEZI|nr:uncharacterized protein CORC01_02677 [Colletotrichum orchidophilum]OHF02098.1 hypothetical protein CORC01_02677 [Colletotrichum orchidophilum]
MATTAPPTYESVIKSLLEKATDGTNVAAAVPNLSSEEKAALNSGDIPPPYTDDEKKKIYDEVAKILAKEETTIAMLKESAKKAVEACKKNDDIFGSLLTLLLRVDNDNKIVGDPFATQLKALREKYRGIIDDSRRLAARIAVYGTNFDEVVVVLCADKTLSIDQRKKAIADAINEAKEFETQSQKIVDDLGHAEDDFNRLAVKFANWAENQSGTLDSQITKLTNELAKLSEKLKNLRNMLIGFGATALVGAAVAFGGCWAGPFAPICWSEIDDKQAELSRLNGNKETIKRARAELVAAAAVDATKFTANMKSITSIWVAAKADAMEIEEWLRKGANLAYMKIQLEHGMALYSKMSEYLSLYASGLDTADIPKPASI